MTPDSADPREVALLKARLGPRASDAVAASLLVAMTRQRGEAGSTLVHQGRWGDTLWFLVAGEARVFVEADGSEVELARVTPGRWVGELQFLEPGPASATVRATTDYTALLLPCEALDDLLNASPAAAAALIRTLLEEMCDRLATTTAGVIERVGAADFKVTPRAERRSGVVGWLQRIFGGKGQ